MRRLAVALAALALSAAATTASALAAPDDYGEVARWGGAAATGDAKIGPPVGFAADPVDDSVYIVDLQSSSTTTGSATFRLRKFAGMTGALLGSATFTSTSPVGRGTPPAIAGVAVDHGDVDAGIPGHVYLAIVAQNGDNLAVLRRVQVYGTDVDDDTLSAPADVPTGELLTNPPALLGAVMTVDATRHDVLVAGVDYTAITPVVARYHGAAADGSSPGDADGRWTGPVDSTGGFALPFPTALAVAANGDVYFESKLQAAAPSAGASLGRLDAALTAMQPLFDDSSASSSMLKADAPQFDYNGAFGIYGLGSQLAVAPDGTLLATTFGPGPRYALTVSTPNPFDAGRSGVRRLTADGLDDGVIAGGNASGACTINGIAKPAYTATGAYGVQPGADGKLFVPSWLPDRTIEVVVFGPGGDGKCPVPAPILATSTADGPVDDDGFVPTGAAATLDLSDAAAQRYPVMEVDWDLDGDAANGDRGDGFEVKARRPLRTEDPESPAPPMTETVTFDTPGDHVVRARILTTAGVSTIARTVHVGDAPVSPSAVLAGPAVGTAGSTVSFDASGSHVNPAGKVADLSHEWDFGDGSGFVVGSAVQGHTYASAGVYSVRVRVTDAENGLTATSDPWTIVVANAPGGGGEQPGGDQRGGVQQPPPVTPPTVPSQPVNPPAGNNGPGVTATGPNLSPKLSVSGTTVTVSLRCPRGKAACSASVVLKAKRGKKTITIGTAKTTIAAGKTKKLKVRLNAAGRSALKSARRLSFTGSLTAKSGTGQRVTTLSGTLKQPRAKKKR